MNEKQITGRVITAAVIGLAIFACRPLETPVVDPVFLDKTPTPRVVPTETRTPTPILLKSATATPRPVLIRTVNPTQTFLSGPSLEIVARCAISHSYGSNPNLLPPHIDVSVRARELPKGKGVWFLIKDYMGRVFRHGYNPSTSGVENVNFHGLVADTNGVLAFESRQAYKFVVAEGPGPFDKDQTQPLIDIVSQAFSADCPDVPTNIQQIFSGYFRPTR